MDVMKIARNIILILEIIASLYIIILPKSIVSDYYPLMLLILVIAGVIELISKFSPKFSKPKLVSYEYNEATQMLTLVYENRTERYTGTCTVWHHYPSGERCSSTKESKLCNIWNKHRRDLMIKRNEKDNIP